MIVAAKFTVKRALYGDIKDMNVVKRLVSHAIIVIIVQNAEITWNRTFLINTLKNWMALIRLMWMLIIGCLFEVTGTLWSIISICYCKKSNKLFKNWNLIGMMHSFLYIFTISLVLKNFAKKKSFNNMVSTIFFWFQDLYSPNVLMHHHQSPNP